ncbi:MAG: BadF/BadG/BcrA/BcrD ATPase family protein [Candidatus Spechtbacterales bacterium]
MKYILGVDAGASRTSVVIADEEGTILGRAMGGPASFEHQPTGIFLANIREALGDAIADASIENHPTFAAACFGVAGVNTPRQQEEAHARIAHGLGETIVEKLYVLNDVQLVLPACTNDGIGIAANVGTGSNIYGRNRKGEEAYAGGLGFILSDEGSSYWIGREALRAATRSHDGRGPKTALEEIIEQHFGVSSMREVAHYIYEGGFDKSRVAAVAKICADGVAHGDKTARDIFDRAAQEVALGVNTVAEKLFKGESRIPVVAVGSTFKVPFAFGEMIQGYLTKRCALMVSEKDSAEGAIKLALRSLTEQ